MPSQRKKKKTKTSTSVLQFHFDLVYAVLELSIKPSTPSFHSLGLGLGKAEHTVTASV